ncbi:MAG: M3 family metallopeptidase [Bauldia sp.]|nr:M3 family metallopeptidase [Bauldia sp.]
MTATPSDNPLLAAWTDRLGLPPFDRIKPEHFRPAFDATMAEQMAAVTAIAGSKKPAAFDNTIAAMERSGLSLEKVAAVFFHLAGADTDDALQAVEREIAPLLARHGNEIYLDDALFRRIEAVFDARDASDLDAEQKRVVERYHTIFVRAGAALDAAGKKRLAAINERLAEIGTLFGQNVLADESSWMLILDGPADLAGLPESAIAAAAEAASERSLPGKHVITLSRSSIEPFLQFSTRRDLREKAFEAWIRRGEGGGKTDNRALISEMISLRAERARLMGYPSYAHFRLADTMAKTPEAVSELLRAVWEPAKGRVAAEEKALQDEIAAEGGNFRVAAWDWRHYAERVRKRAFDFDEAELKPYLRLDRIIEAAFDVAGRLFGLSFKEAAAVSLYNPDVRVWKVTGKGGRAVGVFLGDYFARPSKRSGAWMSALRDQQKLTGDVRPIVVNVMNFAKAPRGRPTLLSFDDARTLFHEFGHALHGLLSDVTYPLIAGTNVARDFVELPSQLYEHWLEEPEVLRAFASHAETGKPMPEALLQKVLAARKFNQGFATVEYAASALVDLDLHLLPSADDLDVVAFEKAALERIGMPEAIVMRHRTPHFAHIFSGDGYAAGYYSYLWSEVLDADAFEAFAETGDIFDADTAKRLHDSVYSAGYLRDPRDAYVAFRGRMPSTEPLLRKRGLKGAA